MFATLNGPLVTDYHPIQRSPWMLVAVALCLLVGAVVHDVVAITVAAIGLLILFYWLLNR